MSGTSERFVLDCFIRALTEAARTGKAPCEFFFNGTEKATNEQNRELTQLCELLSTYEKNRVCEVGLDSTTGLRLREAFFDDVLNRIENQCAFCVVVVNVDSLWHINSQYGYATGDTVLRSLRNYFRSHCAGTEKLYRFGGDDLIAVFEESQMVALQSRMAELYKNRQQMLTLGDGEVVDFSYGCALYEPGEQVTAIEIYERAERLMHTFKQKHHMRNTKWDYDFKPFSGEIINSPLLDIFASASDNQYYFVADIRADVSRWSVNTMEDFNIPYGLIQNFGKRWSELIHPDDRDMFISNATEVFSGNSSEHDLTYRIRNRQGQYVLVSCRAHVLDIDTPMLVGVLTNYGKMQSTDLMTGVPNANAFNLYLESRQGENVPMSLFAFDVNRYQSASIAHGEMVGNMVLKDVLSALRPLLPEQVKIFRLEGARFVLAGENVTEEFLENLPVWLNEIGGSRVQINGEKKTVFFFMTLLTYERFDISATDVQTEIYHALSVSRQRMSGGLVRIGPEQHAPLLKRLHTFERMLDKVENSQKELYLLYQPQFSAETLKMTGFEGLLRIRNSENEVVSFSDFFDEFEKEPSAYQLGYWVLERAFTDTGTAVRANPRLTLSVNVSMTQLENRAFATDLRRLLAKTGFPPKNLILEVTEHMRASGLIDLKTVFAELQSLGVRLSLDDFGTGYANLQQVMMLPYNEVKLDRSVISHIDEKEFSEDFVTMMCRALKRKAVTVVAEGIERDEELDCVRRVGVDKLQGFKFSRPILWEELKSLYLN